MNGAEARLRAAGWTLPGAVGTRYGYLPALLHDRTVYVGGQIPKLPNDTLAFAGVAGRDISVDEARRGAELCALQALAWMREVLGTLDRVERIVRLNGYVQVEAGGHGHMSEIIDAASALFVTTFGDAGHHPRSVLGVAELPRNAPVMIDVTAAVSN